MTARFASAGRAAPSLAAAEVSPSKGFAAGGVSLAAGTTTATPLLMASTGKVMASTGAGTSNAATMSVRGSLARGSWIESGIASGDRRQSKFLFPTPTAFESEEDSAADSH